MIAKQFRITRTQLNKNQIKITGNLITRLKTQPNMPFCSNRYVSYSSQVQRQSTFRQSKRYNSIDYQGRIRQKIISHQSFEHKGQKSSPQSMKVRLSKVPISQSPVKTQILSVRKDFVLNFCKKAKHFSSRRKKMLQNANV